MFLNYEVLGSGFRVRVHELGSSQGLGFSGLGFLKPMTIAEMLLPGSKG